MKNPKSKSPSFSPTLGREFTDIEQEADSKTATERLVSITFPTMANCAAATGIPLSILKQAKRGGSAGFENSRCRPAPIIQWIFAHLSSIEDERLDLNNERARKEKQLADKLERDALVENKTLFTRDGIFELPEVQAILNMGNSLRNLDRTAGQKFSAMLIADGIPAEKARLYRKFWREAVEKIPAGLREKFNLDKGQK